MSARFYDTALVNKLSHWTKDTNVKIYSPSDTKRLFEVIADESGDKPIKLPIICIRRNGGYQITDTSRKPLSYGASTIKMNKEKAMHLNAIPIELRYQIDIYCRYFEEADEFARNIVFNVINFPTVTVDIPYYDEHIEHNSTISLAQDVEDNSDIPERFVPGNFTRLTLSVLMSDAYLWDIHLSDVSSVKGVDVEVAPPYDRDNDAAADGGKGIIIRE